MYLPLKLYNTLRKSVLQSDSIVLIMLINESILHKLAQLTQLKFSVKDKGEMLHDLNAIVAWTSKLDELDTTQVSPLATLASSHQIALREDLAKINLGHEAALANGPDKDTNYFRVPVVKKTNK